VLLATAQIKVKDCKGNFHICRALLDCGSQSNLITESSVRRLGLEQTRNQVPITGINNATSVTNFNVNIEITLMKNDYTSKLNCLILPRITSKMPMNYIDTSTWKFPSEVVLADRDFNKPVPVDILLGAEIFFEIFMNERYDYKGLPVLQNTKLGYILSGKLHHSYIKDYKRQCHSLFVQTDSLHHMMERFWSIEEMNTKILTEEERPCEKHFESNTRRLETGLYEVRLPLSDSADKLGDSYDTARVKFLKLEQMLLKHPQLRKDYSGFLEEYPQLGHMTPLGAAEVRRNSPSLYLPHHGELKQTTFTTKLRVVFSGSEKSSNGVVLNDILVTCPKVQDDLLDIVQKFRLRRIVMSADVAKTYRRIWVHPADRCLQRILLRKTPDQPITIYELNTVMCGTASAPFLATRCLQQLIEDEAINYPEAAKIARDGFYIDDLITGTDDVDTALSLQQDLIDMLKKGGFTLRKWSSNHPALLEHLPPEEVESKLLLSFGDEDVIKTLGLLRISTIDKLIFCVQINQDNTPTKRSILRAIASIYDPLGLLSSVVIQCKIFMEQLWQIRVNWDDPLTTGLKEHWQRLQHKLPIISCIQINRLVITEERLERLEIHGFSDAGEVAYGACIYLRSIDVQGKITTRLLCSKSREAPLKRLSLPRLELCAAMLLADMYQASTRALKRSFNKVKFWTDCMVVPAWLRSPAARWKTFVANRVNHIQETTDVEDWNHIESKENPADLVSCGVDADVLRNLTLCLP
jgi:hypothetical protein